MSADDGMLPPIDFGEARAEVEQSGRWTYHVSVIHGMMSIGPNGHGWLVFGRARAERKARRELEHYRRQEARRAARWTVTLAALLLALAACGSQPAPAATPAPSHPRAAVSQPAASTAPSSVHCGVERWAIKTGADPGASAINLNRVTTTTIAALSAIPAPATLPPAARIPPVETTVYRVTAMLDEYKQEADSDYHLVLRENGAHMIAEIPDPACAAPTSPLLPGIEAARAEFAAAFHPDGSWHSPAAPTTVTVEGPGFFDSVHGQTGVAPDGIELHPVIFFQPGGTASAATAHWLIEQVQFAQLPSSLRQDITSAGMLVTGMPGVPHYTSIASCPTGLGDTPPCLSLTDSPPAAGAVALYDNEKWDLTPASEYSSPCAAAAEAAKMIRAAGATPAISIRMDTAWHVKCAAEAAGPDGLLIAGGQGGEDDTSAYMSKLKWVTTTARAAVPGIRVSFGLSTNPKYSPTAYRMWVDYQHATAYLGSTGVCWLNIIPWPGQAANATAVTMATRFLKRVYS